LDAVALGGAGALGLLAALAGGLVLTPGALVGSLRIALLRRGLGIAASRLVLGFFLALPARRLLGFPLGSGLLSLLVVRLRLALRLAALPLPGPSFALS